MGCILIAQVTISGPGILVHVGQPVPDGIYTPEQVERLLRKGAIKAYSVEDHSALQAEKGRKAKEAEKVPPGPKDGNWRFDPKTLEGADLDTLNMISVSRCEELGIKPITYKTVEEALAGLTADFKA